MTEPLDIFIKANGTYVWKAAADTLRDAKAKVEQLAAKSPGEFMIYNQETSEKIVVTLKADA